MDFKKRYGTTGCVNFTVRSGQRFLCQLNEQRHDCEHDLCRVAVVEYDVDNDEIVRIKTVVASWLQKANRDCCWGRSPLTLFLKVIPMKRPKKGHSRCLC